jgi:hypothetical protein
MADSIKMEGMCVGVRFRQAREWGGGALFIGRPSTEALEGCPIPELNHSTILTTYLLTYQHMTSFTLLGLP